ncbi:Ig-like domain repeat protein [Candidatus Bathyarchaeota archaeon]|nr:MAG: Ig-like domain repeat protein [Candidatus Bathyarchaeota archaeon]
METFPQKKNRKGLIAAIIIIAVIVGGISSYVLLNGRSQATDQPDFKLIVAIGSPGIPPSQWTPLTDTTTLLNGTSTNLVVAANATGGFNDLVQLKFGSPVSGVTGDLPRSIIHPCSQCQLSAVTLTLKIAPSVPAQKAAYNFNVTGTSSSINRTQTFPLRIRSSTLSIAPSSPQVLKPSTFQVGIGISDFYNLQAFQISLDFNQTIVRAVNDTLAPIFYPTGTNVNGTVCTEAGFSSPCSCDSILTPCDGFIAENSLNNTIGKVSIVATLIGRCLITAPCVDSPGIQVFTIANVTFATNTPWAGIASFKLTNAILTDLEGQLPIPFFAPSGFHLAPQNVTVAYRASRTLVSCPSVPHGTMTSCTAIVTDISPGPVVTPSGSVAFASNSTTSSFSSTTCTIAGSGGSASATCSVNYTPDLAGTHVITATYVGDSVHSGSKSPNFNLIAT